MSLARTLASLAVRLAPAKRRPWLQAMQAEAEHASEGRAALSFAAGGLIVAVRLRLVDPPFVHGVARWGLAGAALIWAVLKLRLAATLGPEVPLLTTWALATAAVYAVGALVIVGLGLKLAARLVAPALIAAVLYALGAHAALVESPHRAAYSALALEDAVALATALVIASLTLRYVARGGAAE